MIMAVTTTTASDLTLEPTKKQVGTMATAFVELDGRNWAIGELLNRHIPRVGRFAVRHDAATASSSDKNTEVSEHSVFTRLHEACGGLVPIATMKRLRNTAATFPKEMRVEGASWSAHRAGEALAFRPADKGGTAHRAGFLTWLGSEHRTVKAVEDHVKAMLSKLDGTVMKETETDTEPNGHNVGATATESVTGDEMVAAIIALTNRHDGTEPTQPKAANRALSLAARALGMVPAKDTEKVPA